MVYRKGDWYDTPKVLVEVDKLMQLLLDCRKCSAHGTYVSEVWHGAYLRCSVLCGSCGHSYIFETSTRVGM